MVLTGRGPRKRSALSLGSTSEGLIDRNKVSRSFNGSKINDKMWIHLLILIRNDAEMLPFWFRQTSH